MIIFLLKLKIKSLNINRCPKLNKQTPIPFQYYAIHIYSSSIFTCWYIILWWNLICHLFFRNEDENQILGWQITFWHFQHQSKCIWGVWYGNFKQQGDGYSRVRNSSFEVSYYQMWKWFMCNKHLYCLHLLLSLLFVFWLNAMTKFCKENIFCQ